MYSRKRNVRSNGRTVVGQLSSLKRGEVQFESGLEEGFLYILNFDSDVVKFHDQPLQIKYQDRQGVTRMYTPDYLVEYKNRRPALFEVKSRESLKKGGEDLQHMLEIATDFARREAIEFHVITDKEIYTDYCENVRFLFRYQGYPVDLAITNQILNSLSGIGKSTPNDLLEQFSIDDDDKSTYIAAIWTLVLNKQVGCNLFEKIHMETPIWVCQRGDFKEFKYPYTL